MVESKPVENVGLTIYAKVGRCIPQPQNTRQQGDVIGSRMLPTNHKVTCYIISASSFRSMYHNPLIDEDLLSCIAFYPAEYAYPSNNVIFQIRMEGEQVTHEAIIKVIVQMGSHSFWKDQAIWAAVVEGLPEYRLSKFQRALPAQFSEEMVVEYLLDLAGTQELVARLDN